MLVLGSKFLGTPVMSLQTGTQLAKTVSPVIEPATLQVIAYEVDGPLITEHPSFLRIADIRETGTVGVIIDSSDELVGLHDVIKIEELRKLNFTLVGVNVIDEHRRKLGKVQDFTLETGDFVIQQLNVKRGIFRGITDTGLLIHRSQIMEINDHGIIVKGASRKTPEPVMEANRTDYVNPFRSPAPQPEEA